MKIKKILNVIAIMYLIGCIGFFNMDNNLEKRKR